VLCIGNQQRPEAMNNLKETKSNDRRMPVTLIVLALLAAGALATTAFLMTERASYRKGADTIKLDQERSLGEKLQLEKRLMEQGVISTRDKGTMIEYEGRIADLERRVQEAKDRNRSLEGKANGYDRMRKELAEQKALHAALEARASAQQLNEQELRAQLDRLAADRDALQARIEQQRSGAQMVNNAVVDATHGRKAKLTVKARRTKDLRMAFDLPEHLAANAGFKIITPGGKSYTGNDPSISMTMDSVEPEALASIELMPALSHGIRASRVNLKFTPKTRLEPGTYRIDVWSGDTYLNTVLLNLR
jgi:hypothetical protein